MLKNYGFCLSLATLFWVAATQAITPQLNQFDLASPPVSDNESLNETPKSPLQVTSALTPSLTLQPDLTKQRYHYELAKAALKKGNTTAFTKHYALLGDYPLVPYLDYNQLKKRIHKATIAELETFLAANRGSFLEIRGREQILYELARQQRWLDFTHFFNQSVSPKDLRCLALQARIETGDKTAYLEVAELWTSPKSLPKACDPLFKKWKSRGYLNDDVAWTRLHNAMQRGNISLARYARSLIKGSLGKSADLYIEIHSRPHLVKKKQLLQGTSLESQQIIAHGLKRLSRSQPVSAYRHWEKYEAQHMFPDELSLDTKLYIAKRLTFKGYLAEAEAIVKQSSELKHSNMIGYLIRESLKSKQWDKVQEWIDYLPDDEQRSDRWQYWSARVLEEQSVSPSDFFKAGQHLENAKNQTNKITQIYAELAKSRSFYGFLAADKLGVPYSFASKQSLVNPSTLQTVANHPAMKRAKELWLRNNLNEAHAEWTHATRDMSKTELLAAGFLAKKWGWHNQAINAMIAGKHWDELDVRFPLAYQKEIREVSGITQVAQPLLYAIARQESAFKPKAKSRAGALGLMQILPSTAKQTARKNGIALKTSDLFKPSVNITVGGHYLNELLERFNGNRILAAAAYNAGPHRVSKWLQNTGDLDYDIWIETIPFHETRHYVQNVLAYSVIYSDKLGAAIDLVTRKEVTDFL